MSTTAIDEQKLRRYIVTTLLPSLGCAGRGFSLTRTDLGVHNIVFYLDIEGYKPLVLKAIGRRKRMDMLVACARHLAERGIRAPRVVHVGPDRWLFGRRGFHLVCEERILGTTLFELGTPCELLPGAASFFAALHNVCSARWGTLDRLRSGGLYAHLDRRLQDKTAQWQAADRTFPEMLGKQIRTWAAGWQKKIDAVSTFSLSHGDPNPGNIMVTSEGDFAILDTGHIRYLPRALDYWMVKIHLCRSDAEKTEIFTSAYHQGMEESQRPSFEETEPFFALYVLVDFAAMLAGRLRSALPHDRYYAEYSDGLATARRMIEDLLDTD